MCLVWILFQSAIWHPCAHFSNVQYCIPFCSLALWDRCPSFEVSENSWVSNSGLTSRIQAEDYTFHYSSQKNRMA